VVWELKILEACKAEKNECWIATLHLMKNAFPRALGRVDMRILKDIENFFVAPSPSCHVRCALGLNWRGTKMRLDSAAATKTLPWVTAELETTRARPMSVPAPTRTTRGGVARTTIVQEPHG